MAVDIAKRKADRLRVLQAVFEAADGTTSEVVRVAPTIQRQLILSDEDLEVAAWLPDQGDSNLEPSS